MWRLIEKVALFLLMLPVVVIVYALSYLCLPLLWALTLGERRRVW